MKTVQDMGNSVSDKDINSLFGDILMTEDWIGELVWYNIAVDQLYYYLIYYITIYWVLTMGMKFIACVAFHCSHLYIINGSNGRLCMQAYGIN